MSLRVLLSTEISQNMALLLGGASPTDASRNLQRWVYSVPRKSRGGTSPVLWQWAKTLACVFDEAAKLGAPLHSLLREFLPLVRFEEKLWSKTKSLEKQFGFQGAVILVLPWAVVGLAGFNVELSVFTAMGALLQLLGLGFFYLMIRGAFSQRDSEKQWVLDFLVFTWIRVLSGFTLKGALRASLESSFRSKYSIAWLSWLKAEEAGALDSGFAWPKTMPFSRECADFLTKLLRSGAPAAQILSHWVVRLSEEKQSDAEEKIAMLPSKLSLVFCAFFTPALFLILMGGLWPQLKTFF